VLTLYTTPVIYLAFDRLGRYLRREPRAVTTQGFQSSSHAEDWT
jgi:hypothetical protein